MCVEMDVREMACVGRVWLHHVFTWVHVCMCVRLDVCGRVCMSLCIPRSRHVHLVTWVWCSRAPVCIGD